MLVMLVVVIFCYFRETFSKILILCIYYLFEIIYIVYSIITYIYLYNRPLNWLVGSSQLFNKNIPFGHQNPDPFWGTNYRIVTERG